MLQFDVDSAANKWRNRSMAPSKLRFDEIGYWSEVKLAILREYAKPYNTIVLGNSLHPVYIDGFSGAGHHKSKKGDRIIEGSPKIALDVQPPFEMLHFIDLDATKTTELRRLSTGRAGAQVYEGDCNDILLNQVFPQIKYEQYRRALCILDPYGVNLNWAVLDAAAKLGTIEIFLNFPVMDMNRNVFWHDPEGVADSDRQRMDSFWGNQSWVEAAYSTSGNLFGHPEKETNATIAEAFRQRLQKVAGFKYVPEPMAMRNSKGAIVYYLFFAAQKAAAANIVQDIFTKYAKGLES